MGRVKREMLKKCKSWFNNSLNKLSIWNLTNLECINSVECEDGFESLLLLKDCRFASSKIIFENEINIREMYTHLGDEFFKLYLDPLVEELMDLKDKSFGYFLIIAISHVIDIRNSQSKYIHYSDDESDNSDEEDCFYKIYNS
jgi:hypothetical protein